MSTYLNKTRALFAAALLALAVGFGLASVQQAYADEGGDVSAALEKGFYAATNVESSAGMVPLVSNQGLVYVDANGKANLLVNLKNSQGKYDYLWKGKAENRSETPEVVTEDMIQGIPIPAEAGYTDDIWTDVNGNYGAKNAVFKGLLFIVPLTDEELSAGSFDFQIRRSPWTPLSKSDPEGATKSSNAEKWMGTKDNTISFTAGEKVADVTANYKLDVADMIEAAALTAAIPEKPTAADIDAYTAGQAAYWGLDYSAGDGANAAKTEDYGYELMHNAMPEVEQILAAADAAIPNIVPADGTYEFLMVLDGGNGKACNEGIIGGDRLYSATLTVQSGKMTLRAAQRRSSYSYAAAGMRPSQALAAYGSSDLDKADGVVSYKEVESVYIDYPDNGDASRADGSVTFNGAGEYPMYTATYEIKSLEKPTLVSVMGSRWFNRSIVLHQANMFKSDVAAAIRSINALLNSPDQEDPNNVYPLYKIDTTLLKDADKEAVTAAHSAYEALSAADKAIVDKQMIFSTPADVADGQTYGAALAAAWAVYAPPAPVTPVTPVTPVVPAKKVTTVTVNAKTVNAAAISSAVKKAGGDAKALTTVVLGAKVTKISANAFKGFANVKTVQVKSTKIKKAANVKNCFKGSKVATVKVPKAKLKAYKKIFTAKATGAKKLAVKK